MLRFPPMYRQLSIARSLVSQSSTYIPSMCRASSTSSERGEGLQPDLPTQASSPATGSLHAPAKSLPRSSYPACIPITARDLSRHDASPDTKFYARPRFVHHIDTASQDCLREYYARNLRAGWSVLDLCSSWVSHLPAREAVPLAEVVGVGLNGEELAANEALTRSVVRDLNVNPSLSGTVEGESVDAVVCTVSVDYLIQPLDIFREVNRVLRPGGVFHCVIGDRCFPTKVVKRWLDLNEEGKRRWIGGYFWASEGEGVAWDGVEEVILRDGSDWGDQLWVVRGTKKAHVPMN
jgi:SAM-dependent methyltransferase